MEVVLMLRCLFGLVLFGYVYLSEVQVVLVNPAYCNVLYDFLHEAGLNSNGCGEQEFLQVKQAMNEQLDQMPFAYSGIGLLTGLLLFVVLVHILRKV